MIEIEEKKKEEAALNLFVIDSQTRGIASMLEVVELLVVRKSFLFSIYFYFRNFVEL